MSRRVREPEPAGALQGRPHGRVRQPAGERQAALVGVHHPADHRLRRRVQEDAPHQRGGAEDRRGRRDQDVVRAEGPERLCQADLRPVLQGEPARTGAPCERGGGLLRRAQGRAEPARRRDRAHVGADGQRRERVLAGLPEPREGEARQRRRGQARRAHQEGARARHRDPPGAQGPAGRDRPAPRRQRGGVLVLVVILVILVVVRLREGGRAAHLRGAAPALHQRDRAADPQLQQHALVAPRAGEVRPPVRAA